MRPNVSVKNLGVPIKNRGCQNQGSSNTPSPPSPSTPSPSPHGNNFKRRNQKPLPQISEILKQKRLDKNLTQKQLAETAKISIDTIRHWEQGKSNPSTARMDTIIAVCDVLEIDPVLIFYFKEEDEVNE